VRINEELLGRKLAAPVKKTEINGSRGSAALTTAHPSIRKSLALKFADKRRSVDRHIFLVDFLFM
jgi:hypothetical protein